MVRDPLFHEVSENSLRLCMQGGAWLLWVKKVSDNSQGSVATHLMYKKGKGFPYLLPSIEPGADPSV